VPDPTQSRSRPEGEADQPRLRTAWRIRRRYKRAQRIAALAGAVVALAAVAAVVATFPDPHMALTPGFALPAAALVLGAILLPWLAVGQLWRRTWVRNRHEWGEGALY
jgi:protein-S-isoprenylcysteine O-methyltransferase Ste14